jgi:RsiW-degrading membrane proteinase PrsW (M82 family)
VVQVSAVAAVVPAVFYSLVVVSLDRYEREPTRVMLGAFLWGALVATLIALVLNGLVAAVLAGPLGAGAEAATAALGAPVVEEAAKGAALLILFRFVRREFDNVLDGIVYGGLVGLGFAMTENILYFSRAYVGDDDWPGGPIALLVIFYMRAVLGGLGHAAYTATTGAGLGYARETAAPALKVVVPIGAFLLAMVQHSLWNGLAGSLADAWRAPDGLTTLLVVWPSVAAVLHGPPIAVLVALVWLAWRREARIIAEQLRDEVRDGLLTPAEYERLSSPRRRARAELGALVRGGPGAWLATSRLHQTASDLALCKWHLARERRGPARPDPHEERLRALIADLRQRLGPAPAA